MVVVQAQDETILHGKFKSWHRFAFYELVTGLQLHADKKPFQLLKLAENEDEVKY